MLKRKKLCLILVYTLMMFTQTMLAQFTFAADKILSFAVPDAISINVDHQAYCLFEKAIDNMGYQLERVKVPLIRTITETQKGNMAIVLISRINFRVNSGAVKLPQDIALTSTPFVTTPISFYSTQNSQIIMNTTDWINRYRIGVVRSLHTHNISDYNTKETGNYYFYTSSLAAFKGLLADRQDIVIASELDYLSAQLTLNLHDEVKNISTIGTVSLYPGFSFQYFGKEKAIALAKQYRVEREKLTDAERKQCLPQVKTNR
ncbi:hypothetical protein [Candidatus Colwellia aromaticivorans]|uniref:hypothetical protein n=1 Tax=Candidatus Colwellia aromaticivorans TaxID=2267621 RepID=UPI000DF406C6|nr:hypothetical protein [Candidatus Colwellia aromaticivorans]